MHNASLRELGDDAFMTEKKHIEDVAISNLPTSMGNLNNLPEAMVLFKIVFRVLMLRSYLLLTFYSNFPVIESEKTTIEDADFTKMSFEMVSRLCLVICV